MQDHRLAQSVSSGEWDAVARALDDDFFFYLFTDPDLLERVFDDAPPEWYQRHPRAVMSRAIAAAARRPVMLIDDHAYAQFAAWVGSQARPATRDLLGVRLADLRSLMVAGRYREAAARADDVVELIGTASDVAGFTDVLPLVLLRCGTAKLVAGDVADAVSMYSDALRWATMRFEHPSARFAREHLALVYALTGRYRQARELLSHGDSPALAASGGLQFHYQQPGFLARALVSVGTADAAAPSLDERARAVVSAGVWWWVPAHASAQSALLAGRQRRMIQELADLLVAERSRSGSHTFVGAVLRADLATLHQSVGDLRHADALVNAPGRFNRWGGFHLAGVRQEWLSGRPDAAMALLHESESTDGIPIDHPAERAVLYAETELSASGRIGDRTVEAVAAAIEDSGGTLGLLQASPTLRAHLVPLVRAPVESVPVRFAPRPRPRLTRRERDVLEGLAASVTIPELARALHVSPNTVKSHLRELYQKLGAHNREEALWLSRGMR